MIAKRSDKQVPLRVPEELIRRIDVAAQSAGRSRYIDILVLLPFTSSC